MIRKLLYRFRRMVLVWELRLLQRRLGMAQRFYMDSQSKYDAVYLLQAKIMALDATEMSKGEAYVIVR